MAGPRLMMWRLTHSDSLPIDCDEVLDVTPFTVVTLDGRRHRRSGARDESWYETEQEAKSARIKWLRTRWERALAHEGEAREAYKMAVEGE